MQNNKIDFTNDIFLMKNVLSQICEHLEIDSRELLFLELGYSDEQISKIDGVLISYGVKKTVPSIDQVTKDISSVIERDTHPNVVKRLLTIYKSQDLLPIVSKVLKKMNEL